jgi:branched-chain amino acid aminotransferase
MAHSGAKTELAPLDASKLKFAKTTTPMSVPQPGDPIIATSSQCTDHMITAVWSASSGWAAPELRPYGNLSLAPTASVLHYATECFEGMKMYRGYDGKLRLFRPDANCKRMLISSTRISLPAFDPEELEKLIKALIAVDGKKWLPTPGTFLYLRPTMIGSAGALGVATPKEATLFVIATFMPPLDNPTGMKLLASTDGVRAWPGGFGFAKVGANYGPSLMANGEARARGYDQVLWLLDGKVTEAGASNFFVVWRSPEGKIQLVTAPLDGKIILDGVTRRSILQLVRERLSDNKIGLEPVEVDERNFTMDEVVEAAKDGRVIEAFAAGTAYFVCPVAVINYKEKDLYIPMARGDSGDYAALIKGWLKNIMYGKEQHEWGVVIKEVEN